MGPANLIPALVIRAAGENSWWRRRQSPDRAVAASGRGPGTENPHGSPPRNVHLTRMHQRTAADTPSAPRKFAEVTRLGNFVNCQVILENGIGAPDPG